MIAVDTSALMSIVLDEPEAEACMSAIEADDDLLISAGTMAEALIVSTRRNVGAAMRGLLDDLGLTVMPVTAASVRRIGEAYAIWGRGMHPAGLNFGDCFAYELAKEQACPLLYIGNDFAKTDLSGVLQT